MKRRTLLRIVVSAVATRPIGWVRAWAQAAPLSPHATTTLREVAAIVLPSELGRRRTDEVVDRFQRWLLGYKAGAEMDPGYGVTRLRTTGPFPGRSYAAQLTALGADAQARGGRLTTLAPGVQRAIVESALAAAKVDRLPARPDGGHVISDLMCFYFRSTEANDLCYRARIGRDTCRVLPGSDQPPERLSARGRRDERVRETRSDSLWANGDPWS
ncbi:MAG: hypothetical protein HYZ58_00915 [Acidobacteria bacterium]|nr:hypothetical protein [Acidobacteriota bacterium]MBI3261694.1 hypothetical protein [Acidobacteriota bacterium]